MLIYSLALEDAEKPQAPESWLEALIAKRGQRQPHVAAVNRVVTLFLWVQVPLMS